MHTFKFNDNDKLVVDGVVTTAVSADVSATVLSATVAGLTGEASGDLVELTSYTGTVSDVANLVFVNGICVNGTI